MKTLKLSTNLIGLDHIFCTYWSFGVPEYTLMEEYIEEDFKNGDTDITRDYYWSHFNNEDYMKAWDKKVQDFVASQLTSVFKSILNTDVVYEPKGWWSPREYNFSHDVNNFDLTADFNTLIDYCLEHTGFEKYLKENYSPRDGFRTNTAHTISQWKEDIVEDSTTAYGAAISFLIDMEIAEDIESEKYEVFSEMYYTEFVDYTELDEFKRDLSTGEIDFSDLKDWQRDIIERDVFAPGVLQETLSTCYRESISVENTAAQLQELTESEFDFTNIVTKYFQEVGDQSLKLF